MTLSDRIIDWTMDHVVGWLLIGITVFVVGAIGALIYYGYQDSHSPTISLKKSEWTCTHSHRVTTTTYVMSGKVIVPITTTDNICDNYTMDGYE